MATLQQALAAALQLHRAGRLADAERAYRQVLHADPQNVDALHLLGVLANQAGQADVAVDLIRRAIAIRPALEAAHNNLGNVLREQGKLDEAAECFRKALQFKPAYAEAHYNLAGTLQQQGRLDAAVAGYRRAIELRPGYAEAHNNLGVALTEHGEPDAAIASLQQALQLQPDAAEVHNNLGAALKDQGDLEAAVASYKRALQCRPQYAEAHYNLGLARMAQRMLDAALDHFRRALQFRPDYAEAHNSLGSTLRALGRTRAAIESYHRALQIDPAYSEAHCNLGLALADQKDLPAAVASFRHVMALRPDSLSARLALTHQLQHLCAWSEIEALDLPTEKTPPPEATAGQDLVPPFTILALPTLLTPRQQWQYARAWAERIQKRTARQRPAAGPWQRTDKSKMRLGYLSADFRQHPVARLAVELFARHDRERFDVFAYSYGPDDRSDLRRRVVAAVDRFVELDHDTHLQAAERIAADEIDVLVDLTGYTQHARPDILALRPAPIQVNYLGFPGTMAADFIDYILVDQFVVPADQQPHFTEKLVHLPGCYLVGGPGTEIGASPSRESCNLPAEGLVFCCFNNSYKITREVFAVWMRLLEAVSGSVLWLRQFNRWAPANLRAEAGSRGVDPGRLIFAPPLPRAEHLARYRVADLLLDTFPYNAHATAKEALWSGCPLVTIAGHTFASRVAGSLLTAAGLPELVTGNLSDYEQLALQLAENPDERIALGSRLADARSSRSLFEGDRFARHVEQAYRQMWELHAAGPSPRAIRIEP